MVEALAITILAQSSLPYFVVSGTSGPGFGKKIVLLAGDEEYRSEEALPQLAKILAKRFGFQCTVLFSLNVKGEIDPTVADNQPGLECLDDADLCIMLLRFRAWPIAQMEHFDRYYRMGKPIVALRTSTHAFNFPPTSAYSRYNWKNDLWQGGFGKQVLGETWISHWGNHGSEATRTVAPASQATHPILLGVEPIFVRTDVYEAEPPEDATVLLRGLVLDGMSKNAAPSARVKKTVNGVEQAINDPAMPVAWLRTPGSNRSAVKGRVFTTTMGAATDLLDINLRRLLINASFWALGMESTIPKAPDVSLVGRYKPSPFGFGGYRQGVKPSDLSTP